jgi:flagellar hook protein FlgE
MLKSLFSGVSGLQSHQIAMDVESNNIANVNTVGFKYSRANFADLLAQTNQIATAPQGDLGGKNAVQIGLGTTIGSVTRIHSQGSIQNTDKNTDVAIQGEGYFIVSSDGGSTLSYSRSGDFKFDADGNFVDNNGFIVQGWLRDEATGNVDSTAPIENIIIPPGLTTPANATSTLDLKANLNSSDDIDSFSPSVQLGSYDLDLALSYLAWESAGFVPAVGGGAPAPADAATEAAWRAEWEIYNNNNNRSDAADGNIDAKVYAEDVAVMFNASGESVNVTNGKGIWVSYRDASVSLTRAAAVAETQSLTLNGTTIAITTTGVDVDTDASEIVQAINRETNATGVRAVLGTGGTYSLINDNSLDGDGDSTKNIRITGSGVGGIANQTYETAFKYTYDASGGLVTSTPQDTIFKSMDDMRTLIETHARKVLAADYDMTNPTGAVAQPADGISVVVNDRGQFTIGYDTNTTTSDTTLNLQITSFHDASQNITAASRLTEALQGMNGTLSEGTNALKSAQALNAATHSSSIDIYDSLGSKHTIKIDFRKEAIDTTSGATWKIFISVPEPAEINSSAPLNEINNGFIQFDNEGALSNYSPTSLSFTGNNGSEPNQTVFLDLGTISGYDGVTSFDSASTTSGISQDGFPGGDLQGIRIDQSGTLVGSFSNGRSFGLAQISMAKFANNEGLVADGSNVYQQSANSGDPIIGTAATGGRGFIQSAALEASNVDLSKSLTNLIIIQRGYQANGKTITTSDTLLETLIGLKR